MANWLNLKQLENWEDAFLISFAYDRVTDRQIQRALDDEARLSNVDTTLDWEDDAWLSEHRGIPQSRKHAYRVAALVRELRNGGQLREAVNLDTFNLHQCGYGIGNGHHRIRALQFLGVDAAPFSLSGHVSSLKRLLKVAACDPPEAYRHFFAPKLLRLERHDLRH